MSYTETALRFTCADEYLFGILACPERLSDTGVVIVVGGPQTRVGSHRQFVLLSRALADSGYPVLRFDVRGMGDSTGEKRDFESVTPDIGAAIVALQTACPAVTRIVLWGLCDAASAALLYCDATHDSRITGLCLLNPWVRSAASLAKTQVKHYYGQRLLQKAFWTKLLSGGVNIGRAGGELLKKLGQASSGTDQPLGFQERMAHGWKDFTGPILLILSSNDYTAKEFFEYAASSDHWRGLLERPNLSHMNIADADHTFSSQEWRKTVENACLDWLRRYD